MAKARCSQCDGVLGFESHGTMCRCCLIPGPKMTRREHDAERCNRWRKFPKGMTYMLRYEDVPDDATFEEQAKPWTVTVFDGGVVARFRTQVKAEDWLQDRAEE